MLIGLSLFNYIDGMDLFISNLCFLFLPFNNMFNNCYYPSSDILIVLYRNVLLTGLQDLGL